MKVAFTAALCAAALGSSTAAVYFLSILWWGEWTYPEVVALMCGSAVGAFAALAGAAFLIKRRHGTAAVLRLTMFLAIGWGAVSTGLFFGVLANCNLSCENAVKSEFRSPTSQWKAVWFSRSCVCVARYRPTISYISVLAKDETLPGTAGDAFGMLSLGGDDGLRLKWKSEDLLFIEYPGIATIVRQQNHVGAVRLEYRPIGFL